MTLQWKWLGRVGHASCAQAQRDRRDAIISGEAEEVIWLLEHPPTVTVGRRPAPGTPSPEVLASHGVDHVVTERGGLATYHGPGQLVAYPLIRLSERGFTVKAYVSRLEQVVRELLAELGVAATLRADARGVFVGDDKIAAIGVHIRRGVTMHGLAVNVSPSLEHFGLIVPCGLVDIGVTSLRCLDVPHPPIEKIAANLGRRLAEGLQTH